MEVLSKHCKDLGNIEIRKKQYADAVSHYTEGLSISPNDIDLMSNRAVAYLHLGCYNCALSDIDTVLDLNPNHAKCLYRKVKVLWGLQKYQEAIHFMEKKIPKATLTQPDFQNLLLQCHKFLEQSKGNYEIHDLMTLSRTKVNEIGEYTGPVEVAKIPGKGRGLQATSDINKGQLIVCSKAFFLLYDDDPNRPHAVGGTHAYLVASICHKLSLEPSFRPTFFDLYSGPSDVIPEISKTTQDPISKEEVRLVGSIVANNFTSCEMDLSPSPWTENILSFQGVWLLPSYVNHSCMDANAHYYIYGDVMLVRAIKEIKKGQEVIFSYIPLGRQVREKFFQKRGFKCDCCLCLMGDLESEKVKREVESNLELVRNGLNASSLEVQVSRIRRIISLREKFSKTNLALLDPCVEMVASALLERRIWGIVCEILEKSHEVARNTCYAMKAVYISLQLVKAYRGWGKKDLVSQWIQVLKDDLIVSYGSYEALNYLDYLEKEDEEQVLKFINEKFSSLKI